MTRNLSILDEISLISLAISSSDIGDRSIKATGLATEGGTDCLYGIPSPSKLRKKLLNSSAILKGSTMSLISICSLICLSVGECFNIYNVGRVLLFFKCFSS